MTHATAILSALLILGVAPSMGSAQEPAFAERSPWSPWLAGEIAKFETLPRAQVPFEVWQVTFKGKQTYFFVSPCCDQYNPLYSYEGRLLCNPSGGHSGRGDNKCPSPADPGTKVSFVWAHQDSQLKNHTAPRLGQK